MHMRVYCAQHPPQSNPLGGVDADCSDKRSGVVGGANCMLYTVPVDVLVYSTVTGEEYAVVYDSSRSHWRCRRYYLALEISRHNWLIRDISVTSESIKPVRNCSDLAMQVGDLCIHTGVVEESIGSHR